MVSFIRKTRCSLLGHEPTLKMLWSVCQSIYHLLWKDVETFLTPTSEIMALHFNIATSSLRAPYKGLWRIMENSSSATSQMKDFHLANFCKQLVSAGAQCGAICVLCCSTSAFSVSSLHFAVSQTTDSTSLLTLYSVFAKSQQNPNLN